MSARPRVEQPRRFMSPSKRGYAQVYLSPDTLSAVDAYREAGGHKTRQDAIVDAIAKAQKNPSP
jgi:hypothetical protein